VGSGGKRWEAVGSGELIGHKEGEQGRRKKKVTNERM